MRLFFALPVPPPIARRAGALRRELGPARWADPGQLHLTLRFLGEVDEEAAARVVAEVDAGVRPARFDLRLAGLGRFGWRVIFAGVEPAAPVSALATTLEAAVRAAGLPGEDRVFRPHVTLARLRHGVDRRALQALLEAEAAFRTPAWSVDALHLVRSHLGEGGARHETWRRWPLEASSPR